MSWQVGSAVGLITKRGFKPSALSLRTLQSITGHIEMAPFFENRILEFWKKFVYQK